MSWFSILPAHLTVVETWIIRFFLLMTILTIGPWALFLLYDLILYFIRTLFYEIPFYGGRAQGKRRPAKPSLDQRPDGRRRVLSMSFGGSGSEGSPAPRSGSDEDGKERGGDEGWRHRDGRERVMRRRRQMGDLDADGGVRDEAVDD